MKYSDVKLGENEMPELEEWSVDKHTEEGPTDAYGIINFQGGSHSYRAKVSQRWLRHRASETSFSYSVDFKRWVYQ